MATLPYPALPEYTRTMHEAVAKSGERAWRLRKRLLAQDIIVVGAAFTAMQACYWKCATMTENKDLSASMAHSGSLLQEEQKRLERMFNEAQERLTAYCGREGRTSILDRT